MKSGASDPAQPQAVHTTGHVDVGQQYANIVYSLQEANGLVGVSGLDSLETSVLHDVDCQHANEGFVFNYQNFLGHIAPVTVPDPLTCKAPHGSVRKSPSQRSPLDGLRVERHGARPLS